MSDQGKGKLRRSELADAASHLPGYLPKGARPLCRLCGVEMHPIAMYRTDRGTEYGAPGFFKIEKAHRVSYGYEGNGHVCTLRCGYLYAIKILSQFERRV